MMREAYSAMSRSCVTSRIVRARSMLSRWKMPISSMLVRHSFADRFPGLAIAVPRTVMIGADEYEHFLETNAIGNDWLLAARPEQVVNRFLEGQISPQLLDDLEHAVRDLRGPLAVRSSSLLEDSRFLPFAGVYATTMLPNNTR